jgi:hypothetical protein
MNRAFAPDMINADRISFVVLGDIIHVSDDRSCRYQVGDIEHGR